MFLNGVKKNTLTKCLGTWAMKVSRVKVGEGDGSLGSGVGLDRTESASEIRTHSHSCLLLS